MPRVEAWELVKEFLFPGRSAHRAVPPLDGGLTPNDALDASRTAVGITAPEDVCLDDSERTRLANGLSVESETDRRLYVACTRARVRTVEVVT